MSDQPESVVTVLPGVPAMPGLTVDDGIEPFPDTTVDFVKILRDRGIAVEFAVPRENRRYVGHKAYELWLPILEFSMNVLAGLEAGILVELVKTYLDPQSASRSAPELEESEGVEDSAADSVSPAILHVEWRVTKPDGGAESFVANGSAAEVLEALEQFERHVRDE